LSVVGVPNNPAIPKAVMLDAVLHQHQEPGHPDHGTVAVTIQTAYTTYHA
jgi:hypothetical protein